MAGLELSNPRPPISYRDTVRAAGVEVPGPLGVEMIKGATSSITWLAPLRLITCPNSATCSGPE